MRSEVLRLQTTWRHPLWLGLSLLFAGARSLPAEESTSPRLGELRKQIAAGEAGALESFWRRIAEEGTPLVEPVEGAKGEVLVTYLWRGGDETKNVLVVISPNDLATAEGIAGARLERLAQTDLWPALASTDTAAYPSGFVRGVPDATKSFSTSRPMSPSGRRSKRSASCSTRRRPPAPGRT